MHASVHASVSKHISLFFGVLLTARENGYTTSQKDGKVLEVPQLVPSIHQGKKQFGFCFSHNAPELWNEFGDDICSAAFLLSFRKKLEVYLFIKAYPPLVHCVLLIFSVVLIPHIYVSGPYIFGLFISWLMCLRVCTLMAIKRYKSLLELEYTYGDMFSKPPYYLPPGFSPGGKL